MSHFTTIQTQIKDIEALPCRVSEFELAKLKPRSTEVDQEAMLHVRGAEIAKDLSGMLVNQCLAGFQFDNETVLDKKIRVILSKSCAVLIRDLQWILTLKMDPGLFETMGQSVFIYLLHMSMPQVPVQCKADLANPVT